EHAPLAEHARAAPPRSPVSASAPPSACEPRGLDYAAVRACFGQLLAALAALHATGLVHRDVKPSNVLVETGGRVVLLDLGLVLPLDHEATGAFAGTAAYASPEQLLGEPVDERSDVYAAGTILYE